MRNIILFMMAIFAFASVAHAEPFVGLGVQTEFVSASDGRSTTTDQPLSFQIGWRFLQQVDLFGELSTYSATDGDNAITVSRTHYEWLAWLRYAFLNTHVSPYVAIGAGTEYDVVNTTVISQSDKQSGSAQFEGAAALGVQMNVWEGLDLRFEARAKTAGYLAPNPLMGVGAFLSWRFN